MNRVLVAAMALLLLIGLGALGSLVLPWAVRFGARAFKTKPNKEINGNKGDR